VGHLPHRDAHPARDTHPDRDAQLDRVPDSKWDIHPDRDAHLERSPHAERVPDSEWDTHAERDLHVSAKLQPCDSRRPSLSESADQGVWVRYRPIQQRLYRSL